MDRKDAIAWVLSTCLGVLRKSQAKTLSELVGGTLSVDRLTLAGIGRQVAAAAGSAAKHQIKRGWRFIANRRVEPLQVMPSIMNRLWRRKLKWHRKNPERRPLLVSMDWTKVRSYHTLMAAMTVEGRALPLCWQSSRSKVAHTSQNAQEYAMLLKIKAALPPGIRVVIVADRGFGRAGLISQCQRLGLDYLVRVKADVTVKTGRWRGTLKHYPIRRGQCRGWTGVDYRQDGVVQTNLIVRWKKGLAAGKDQPWHLVTSLPLNRPGAAARLSDLYALRFDIEELFRDAKNEHLGWSLSKTRITRADRLDRLILIGALAYVLLVALGLWCREHRPPRLWASNNRRRELSAYAIGRLMLRRLTVPVADLLRLLLQSLVTPLGKWG